MAVRGRGVDAAEKAAAASCAALLGAAAYPRGILAEEDTSDEGPFATEISDSSEPSSPESDEGAPCPARRTEPLVKDTGEELLACILPLPRFNDQRYQFWRVLMPAPRSGGQIELYMDRMTGAMVAVKRVPRERILESPEAYHREFPMELEDPWQELLLTHRLGAPGPEQAPGVCPCHGAFMSAAGDALLVSDYQPGGDLFDLAANGFGAPGPSREEKAWPLVCSLLEAVLALHDRGVAHGDVSLENTLRKGGGGSAVALVDFGMAVVGDLARARGVRGKPSYQAPEMHMRDSYDARSADLFACGVVAYCLAVGGYPWSTTKPRMCMAFGYAWRHGLHAFLQRRRITVADAKVPVASCLSPAYLRLLCVLLDFDPQRRAACRSCLH